MIGALSESLIICLTSFLYWVCRDRRRRLKGRIGKQAFRNVFQMGRNLSFMLRRQSLDVVGDTEVLRRGCILYSFHYGIWESMPCTLRRLGYRIGIIVNRYGDTSPSAPARFLDRFLLRWRAASGVKVFYADNVLGIARFLRAGGIFGMLVDGNTFFQKYVKAEKLARVCRVPLVPFTAYRDRGHGYLRIGGDLIQAVSARPLDYVWAYRSR